ncbi:redoxin domain-containing protein [Polaribacter batillariae]|uniref:Redoxin domain-containing protein n=1 Tax=Polaribacter batillariae TaxID=2808900 RepID=A0ABX7SS84_9FLAO|nr:redoxin domain-containing protein [Polaribacter batillariae]QTD36732.1 redoxin domain-containing protein [Polaribacter batillariae]
MKKKIRIFVLILIASIFGFLGFKINSKLSHKKEVTARTKTIPSFSFSDTKGNIYSNKNLPNKSVIFIYFNSGCDYCQSEAIKIQERLKDFKEVQLVFVSFEEQEGIIAFAKQYNLHNKENVVFLEDKQGVFSQIFDVNSIPYIVVYDKDKNFLQKFKGATKIDSILAVLK